MIRVTWPRTGMKICAPTYPVWLSDEKKTDIFLSVHPHVGNISTCMCVASLPHQDYLWHEILQIYIYITMRTYTRSWMHQARFEPWGSVKVSFIYLSSTISALRFFPILFNFFLFFFSPGSSECRATIIPKVACCVSKRQIGSKKNGNNFKSAWMCRNLS